MKKRKVSDPTPFERFEQAALRVLNASEDEVAKVKAAVPVPKSRRKPRKRV